MPSPKVLAGAVFSILSALFLLINELQDIGVTIPPWLTAATALLAPFAFYLKRDTNPAPSSMQAARRILLDDPQFRRQAARVEDR